MKKTQDKVFKVASIGALVACLALIAFVFLYLVLGSPWIFPAVQVPMWVIYIAACIWAIAQIPLVWGLSFLVKKKRPITSLLAKVFWLSGAIFCLVGFTIFLIIFYFILGGPGPLGPLGSNGSDIASKFVFLGYLWPTFIGLGFTLMTVAMFIFGLLLFKNHGILKAVGWILILDAIAIIVGGSLSIFFPMNLVFPSRVAQIVSNALTASIPVLLMIIAYVLMVPMFLRLRTEK